MFEEGGGAYTASCVVPQALSRSSQPQLIRITICSGYERQVTPPFPCPFDDSVLTLPYAVRCRADGHWVPLSRWCVGWHGGTVVVRWGARVEIYRVSGAAPPVPGVGEVCRASLAIVVGGAWNPRIG